MYQINLFLKPISICVLVLIFDNAYADIEYSDETYSDGYPQKCFPLERRHGVCEVMQSFYNVTTFPNMLGHQSIAEAKEEFLDYQLLIDANCSKSLEKLLCFIYFPPCTQYKSLLQVCQSYCEDAVTEECRDILIRVKKQPPALECGQYPRSDNQDNIICITPNDTLSTNGGTVATATSRTIISPHYIDETSRESEEEEIDLNFQLLVINGDTLQLLKMETSRNMDAITLFRMQTQLMSTYMDYYGPSEYIFWSSSTEAHIFRGKLNIDSLVGIRDIIDTGSASVESIAVDWNLRVLFWTESVPVPRLRTSSLSGRMVTTLLSEGMKKPKCLTTDPLAGKLFWIDRRGAKFDESSIESFSIVSEKYSPVFNITSTSIKDGGRATALVADVKDKRLYFVDARAQSLHSIKYDGSDLRVLLEGKHPLLQDTDSLAIHGDHILWIDTVENNLIWADKKTGDNVQKITRFGKVTPQNMKVFIKQSRNGGLSSYDKSSLTEKWHELSSKENMEDVDDDDDDDFYDYEEDTNRKKKPTTKKSAAGIITLNFRLFFFIIFLDLVLHV